MMCRPIPERVQHLRILLAHHSYIYYILGHTVINDGQWDAWAAELKTIQDEHGYRFDIKYDKWFKDWDGTTGYTLCNIHGLKEAVARTNPELVSQ